MNSVSITFKPAEAFFYHIYPLGFCGAPEHNDYQSHSQERLLKVAEWIPHLKELGVTALYLGPIFESSSHGYDTVSYYHVDRRLGTNDTLHILSEQLHQNGISLILDGVFNHSSRDFFAFQDILKYGRESRYAGYYHINWDRHSPLGDPFDYQCWDGHYSLPKFNLSNPEVRDHLLNAVRDWIEEYGIDGLRLDAADVLDLDFMEELRRHTGELRPGFWLMGEIVHGDYRRLAGPGLLQGVTNYECYKGIWSSHNDRNYFEIAYALDRQYGAGGIYRGIDLYNFTDNHDVDRLAGVLKERRHFFSSLVLLFTMPGIPSLYYGSEWGICGKKGGAGDRELRPELDLDRMYHEYSQDILQAVKRLASVRRDCHVLQYGDFQNILVNNEYYIFSRRWEGKEVLVALNLREESAVVELAGRAGSGLDVLNQENISLQSFSIPGGWGRVIYCP